MSGDEPERLPRLGERSDLRIDVSDEAIDAYLEYARRHDPTCVDREMARRDLIDTLRESYVISSIGPNMQTRYRNRRRDLDLIASLHRSSPTHVRCLAVLIRRRASSNKTSGRAGRVRSIAGQGSVRIEPDGSLSWRYHGESEWGPVSLEQLARDYDATHPLWQWLARAGYRRPG